MPVISAEYRAETTVNKLFMESETYTIQSNGENNIKYAVDSTLTGYDDTSGTILSGEVEITPSSYITFVSDKGYMILEISTENTGVVFGTVQTKEEKQDEDIALNSQKMETFSKELNLYDYSYLISNLILSPTGALQYAGEQDYSVIFPIFNNSNYTLDVSGIVGQNRFRLALTTVFPENNGSSDVQIDESSLTEYSFESGSYNFCICMITSNSSITGEPVITTDNKGALLTSLGENIVEFDVDPNNIIWYVDDGRLSFGIDEGNAPLPLWIHGQIIADGTIIARNTGDSDYNRHGYHVYEGYSSNGQDRITLLVDKHNDEFLKEVSEQYYYIGSNHRASSYGYMRIGSDVKGHSFLFDRDTLTALGEINMGSVLTFARIDPTTDLDDTYATVEEADVAYEPEMYPEENYACLLYIALANATDGATFYDTNRNKLVTKINGLWSDIDVTDASSNYPF